MNNGIFESIYTKESGMKLNETNTSIIPQNTSACSRYNVKRAVRGKWVDSSPENR